MKAWRNPLVRDLTLVLLIKLALITGLWYAFFRNPLDERLDDQAVSAAVLGPRAGPLEVSP